MEFKFIVVDEYGESVRAFYTKEDAERFISIRPECRMKEIPHEDIPKEDFNFQDLIDKYGEPPF